MTLKSDAKFKGKLTHGLKNDILNLVNFHASSWKSENLHFDGFLWSKAYKILFEKAIIYHDSDEWCKVWRKTGSWLQKWHYKFGNFNTSYGKSEILVFDVLFLSIAIKFYLKKCSRVISNDNEEWSKLWRKTHFLFEKWHENSDEF